MVEVSAVSMVSCKCPPHEELRPGKVLEKRREGEKAVC